MKLVCSRLRYLFEDLQYVSLELDERDTFLPFIISRAQPLTDVGHPVDHRSLSQSTLYRNTKP